MIAKHPLCPERVRRPPREGFSWIDRRFLRVHAKRLTPEANYAMRQCVDILWGRQTPPAEFPETSPVPTPPSDGSTEALVAALEASDAGKS